MFWNKYFKPSFLILILIAILHWIASYEGYYWTVYWYDFMMHFLGGAWVALVTLWVSETSYGAFLRPYASVRNLLIFTFAFGVAWEILELALGFTYLDMAGYAWDTTHDLIMDVFGAWVAIKVFKK